MGSIDYLRSNKEIKGRLGIKRKRTTIEADANVMNDLNLYCNLNGLIKNFTINKIIKDFLISKGAYKEQKR